MFDKTLNVRCNAKGLAIFVTTPHVLKDYAPASNTTPIRYKFDNEQTQSLVASEATNLTAFFLEPVPTFLSQLKTHASLTIGYTPYDSGEQEASFTLTGLTAALAPMRGQCGQ